MKIEKYINEHGEWSCFVVSNSFVSRSGLTRMINSCDGVLITKKPKLFDVDVFCKFEINGYEFYIEEPYGDSSTYDVIAPEAGLMEMEILTKHIEVTSPIKGGDFGHKLYFLTTAIIGSLLMFGIIRAIWI